MNSVEKTTDEVVVFLLAYLLPTVSTDAIAKLPMILYVLGVLFVAIYVSDSYHFNPLMTIVFGRHFYKVRSTTGAACLVISRTSTERAPSEKKVVEIRQNIFLEVRALP